MIERGQKADEKESILVVDDESAVRELLVAFFRDVGYRADATKSGKSALRWLARNQTNMVLLDVQICPCFGLFAGLLRVNLFNYLVMEHNPEGLHISMIS